MQVKTNFIQLRKQLIEKDFSKMNNMQKKAVFHTEGPLLILAGAGSGKTTVLINRIANLLKYGKAYQSDYVSDFIDNNDVNYLEDCLNNNVIDDGRLQQIVAVNPPRPWEILAITFTNKAANELKERLEKVLGPDANDIWAATFHSACLRILRRFAERIGYSSHFTIYDTDDSRRLIKKCQKELGIDDKLFPHRSVLSAISHAKDSLITPEEFEKEAQSDYRQKKISELYTLYQSELKKADAMDFDDIIVKTVELFEKNPDVLSYWQNKFRYIMVDEYQDTNHAQYVLVSMLSESHKNICVVGDDNQSIYTFRGATIENILNFEHEFKNATTIRLEQNYRSTSVILDAANAVIKNNKNQKEKNLWTEREGGDKITLYSASDEMGETKYICDQILDSVKKGGKFSDNCILYRMNAQSRNFERSFALSAIPYRIIGGLKFYDRKEIKDILSYLTLCVNPADNLRLSRIINEPKRGIGATTLEKVSQIASFVGTSMFEVMLNADNYESLSRASSKLKDFAIMMQSITDKLDELSLYDFYKFMIEKIGYIEYLKEDPETEEDRIKNLEELGNSIAQFEQESDEPTLENYLDGVALMTDIDNYNSDVDAVILMTLHSAKGLEFENVYIVGMEEGIFPGKQSIFTGDKEIEEERRLAYVGITRAKTKLTLTNSLTRMVFGTTERNRVSRFVIEIPTDLLDNIVARPSAFSTYKSGFASSPRDNHSGYSSRNVVETNKKSSYTPLSDGYNKSTTQAPSGNTFKAGDTVSHTAFGTGVILSAAPVGGDVLLTIAFDKVGTKKLMQKYAKLTKVN